MDNMFSDLIPNQQPQNTSVSGSQNMFSDLTPQQQSSSPNYLSNRQQQISDIISNYNSGKLNPVGATAGVASTGLGLVNDTVSDIAKSAYNSLPNPVTNTIDSGVSALEKGYSQTPQGKIMSLISPLAKAEYQQFSNQYPNLAQFTNLGGNVAKALPVASVADSGAKILGNMGEESGVSINNALGGIPNAAQSGIEKYSPTLQTQTAIDTTNAALKANKNVGYGNAKNMGAVLTPYASDHVAITVPSDVESTLGIRLDPNDPTYSQTRSALTNLQNKSSMGLTTNDLEQTRQRLNDILNGTSSGGDRMAAVVAKKSLDNIYTQIEQNPGMLVNNNPEAIQAFRDARDANGVYQRHTDISNIVSDARGNPQKIQSAFQKLVSSKKENDFNLYAPDEQDMIESIAYPKGTDTKLEGTGLASQAMHGAGIGAKATAGYALGEAVGHPVAGAIIGGGQGIRTALSDTAKAAKTLKGADTLLQTIASKTKPITPLQGSGVKPFNSNVSQFNNFPIMGFQEDPEIAARQSTILKGD